MKHRPNQIFNRLHEFEKYLKQYEIDLFISHEHWGGMLPVHLILFFKLSGSKMGMEFHADLSHYVAALHNMWTYRLTDFLVGLSREIEEYWQNFSVPSYCIPNPTIIKDGENFHGRDPKKNSKTILYVGRIGPAYDKNTEALLPILQEVVKKIPEVKLKIVGEIFDEDVFKRMKDFIEKSNLESNVEFCGYHTNVSEFYESADIMLVTSPSEGFGLAIAESKFYELPLVCYKLDRNELLRDGKGYIAVEQGDFRGAARAIIKILTDTELRCRLSAEAKESIQPFLDYDVAGAWQRVFEDLENDVPAPPHKSENEEIQKFFVNELWKNRTMINNLIQHINHLENKN